jgi:hypothetical protein
MLITLDNSSSNVSYNTAREKYASNKEVNDFFSSSDFRVKK